MERGVAGRMRAPLRAPVSPPHPRRRWQPCVPPLRTTPAPQRTSPPCARQSPLRITRPKKSIADTLTIAGLFATWYMSNIYFNIYNKQVLTAFGHPATCTLIHLAVGSVLAVALWVTRVKKVPPFTPRVVDLIFPLAILHLLGFFTTNASLGAVAVSLTHTIKSMEPFFTVVLSWMLMSARPAKRVLFSLVPIVVGVVVASATDISFTWAGFNAAMLSNLALQTRNVLSKKAMMRTSYESLEGGGSDVSALDEVNIFALMSMGACLLGLPLVAALDGPSLWALGGTPADWMSADMWRKIILAGICRCVSYWRAHAASWAAFVYCRLSGCTAWARAVHGAAAIARGAHAAGSETCWRLF